MQLFSYVRFSMITVWMIAGLLMTNVLIPLSLAGAEKLPEEPPVIRVGSRYQEPFVIHSIPKCGTHLIQRLVWFLTGRSILVDNNPSQDDLRTAFDSAQAYRIHAPFNPNLLNSITQLWGHKLICMLRDPRDALVSHTFYMRSFEGSGLKRDFFTVSEQFDSLSFDEQLTSLMVGSEHSPSYMNFYEKRTGWALSGKALPVYFEDLVGSQGGGIDRRQRHAIMQIAKYIGIKVSKKELKMIQQQVFKERPDKEQDGKTFERGHIGNWKTFFTDEHKELFKQSYGQLLIDLGYEKDLNW